MIVQKSHKCFIIFLSVLVTFNEFSSASEDDWKMHPIKKNFETLFSYQKHKFVGTDFEKSMEFWNFVAQLKLRDKLLHQRNFNVAKNVIFFLGDGMSLPTITASRIYMGQKSGQSGEESKLFFEDFPYVGLSKTYCVDKQTADSACSATAYLCGVKNNYGTLGVTAKVDFDDCKKSLNKKYHVSSLLQWAQRSRKATGIVTTTRITHASPAGAYAHAANRDWECDSDIPAASKKCDDIAKQLVRNGPGKNINVIFGGGRAKFLPRELNGQRDDGLNLIEEWKQYKAGLKGKYVYNKKSLMDLNFNETDFVLGLFEQDHLRYNLDADPKKHPSLSELTASALQILSRNNDGFVLFVEGGRIDHAHHSNLAKRALDETVEFSEAVRTASELVDTKETLIIVTADHSHTLSIAGYSNRGEDILGLNSEVSEINQMPYTTLSYANGPSANGSGIAGGISEENLKSDDFEYPSLFPKEYETHGADDVPVYAIGPWSHLFTGTYEQNVIPHFLAFASCIGDGVTACSNYF